MGSRARNTHRQPSDDTITPETVGPRAGAAAVTIVTRPIVRPRRSAATTCITVVNSSGSITAVPRAWMIRAARSTPKSGAVAAIAVPTANSPDVFDADPEGRDRFLRVRRLMRDNPALLAAGLERDARLTEHIAAALSRGPGLDPLDAYAVAESFALGMRLTFDEWVRRADEDPLRPPSALRDVYRDARAALGRANRTGAS